MILNLKPNSFFVFDLDDTLYQEIDYLKSAYKYIAGEIKSAAGDNVYQQMLERYMLKENAFQWLVSSYSNINPNITVDYLLELYRTHMPDIQLTKETKFFLDDLKKKNILTGLITDGRSITQRNKLKALGLEEYFQEIIISEEFGSEKPAEKNYIYFQNKYQDKIFYFIGDNLSKDFIVPLKLGWFTICLKNSGSNIHPQNLIEDATLDLVINSFKELMLQ